MLVFYLQCDLRYNNNLLNSFCNTTVIGYVINKIRSINFSDDNVIIVAHIYNCATNNQLIEYLKGNNINVILSDTPDITQRLIEYCETFNEKQYIIRVLGEQILLNQTYCEELITQMLKTQCDYYYDEINDGQVPEVVSSELILKNKAIIGKYSRYYHAYKEIQDISTMYYNYDRMPVRIIGSDKFMLAVIEEYLSNENILEFKNIVKQKIYRMVNNDTALTRTGYFQTLLTNKLFDAEKSFIPWFTYPCIFLLKQKLQKYMNVFEYGCGYSTFFLSDRCNSVISVEHDKTWFEYINDNKNDNCEIIYKALEYGGEYSKVIKHYTNQFDVILIDGRDRVNCAKNCLAALKSDGIIVWDDSDRTTYSEGYDFLISNGFKRLDLCGLLPSLTQIGFTSIFYRVNNCFDL